MTANAKSQATDAASSRQVACTDGLEGGIEMTGNWMNWMARAEEKHGREFDAVEREIFKAGFEAGHRMAELPDTFWNDDAQYDTPTDCEIMQGRELGEIFKLTAAWYRPALFKVVKVPDDESDDYAVAAMPSNALAQGPGGSSPGPAGATS